MRLSLSSSRRLHHIHNFYACRSSRSQMSFKIGVLKNFLQACTFIKKRLQPRCFSVKLAKFLRTPFFKGHLRWLLLPMLLFMDISSFTSPLPLFHYLLTVILLSSFEETLPSLYHYYIINTIAESFSRIAAIATIYCTAISMIVIRVSALMSLC